MLWLYLLLEPVKRVLSAVLYPVAYALRRVARDTSKVMRPEYLYSPRPFMMALWFLLDDSIHMEQGREYDDSAKRYPATLWRAHNDFLLAYWWSAIRNSCVNWNNWAAMRLGAYKSTIRRWGSARNFYETRQYEHGRRSYMEFWIMGRWFQVGWLKGTSCRFEIDLFKKK
jgi:hypothetical protein